MTAVHTGHMNSLNNLRHAITCLVFCIPGASLAPVVHETPHGMRVTASNLSLEVIALREDVLQVREWRESDEPEDSSWAVLASARTARTSVTPMTKGFRTTVMEVTVDDAMRLTVRDLKGRVLQQQAEPVQYDGTNFRLYMDMTDDEHFFGLGDKVGPLDRRGMSFVNWNTDHA